jgi:hypothetical protein
MSAPSNWPHNRLLLALPPSDLQQIMPEPEHIRCEREQVLMDADSPLDHVFFLDSGVVSVAAVYLDGSRRLKKSPRTSTSASKPTTSVR